MKEFIYPLIAAGSGACLAMQAAANTRLRNNLDTPDGPLVASFLSVCGTITTATLAMLLFRSVMPTWESVRATQWWNWVGGPLGVVVVVLAGAMLVKDLGSAAFVALVVGGQLLCSVLLDHFGLMGLAVQELTWNRVLGVVLIAAGVACVKLL